MGLSVIVITRNEEANIAACLESVAFADEIVVVDSGSSDRTADIARAFGAHVTVTPDWPGFGRQKQRALDMATQDWVLSLDADERIPEGLRGEILRATGSDVAGFRINRLSSFLGKAMRHGGWFPDRILRLARRDRARFTDDVVHERLVVDGPVGDLSEPMLHNSYDDVDDVLRKMRTYALAAAERRRREGIAGGLGIAIARSAFAFFRGYVLRGGFLDGGHGFVAASYRAHETFWRYLSLGWDKGR
ncbi:MAG: glycosyltransferase family 2 protein [Rhizobiaceae bacterium]